MHERLPNPQRRKGRGNVVKKKGRGNYMINIENGKWEEGDGKTTGGSLQQEIYCTVFCCMT